MDVRYRVVLHTDFTNGVQEVRLSYFEHERDAAKRVEELLALPPIPQESAGHYPLGEHFHPWVMFQAVYGVYDSDFDDLAIAVLESIRDKTRMRRDDLASDVFREMLCVAGLCDYGTSPRYCFPTSSFAPMLHSLIERWIEYRALRWRHEHD